MVKVLRFQILVGIPKKMLMLWVGMTMWFKGFSTDMYVKVKTKDGQEIMDEVSLKKNENINFLNSSTGKFREWDEDSVGSEIDVNNMLIRKEIVLTERLKNLIWIYLIQQVENQPKLFG